MGTPSAGIPIVTPITAAVFRTAFPELSSTTLFPDSGIAFWSNVAQLMLNQQRWGNTYGLASLLFIAHNMVLGAINEKSAANGQGIPGLVRGPLSGESALGLSASYDSSAATDPGAGHWNLTTYGIRLRSLINMFGAGPVYVGPGGWGGQIPGGYFGQCTGFICGPGWFAVDGLSLQ